MKVLVAGGGTGGHLYPALAFIEGLRRRYGDEVQIAYVGTRRGLEARVLDQGAGVQFFTIQARGLERHLTGRAAVALGQNGLGLAQTLHILKRFRPQLIFGTGGYGCFAPLFWGSLLRIPTVIHEQNVLPGLVNRLMAPRVDCVLLSYPDTARYVRAKRWVVTGVPLRPSILEARTQLDPQGAKRLFHLDPVRPLVLVMGGSHGARALHEPLLPGIARLQREGIQLVLLAGGDATRLRAQLSKEGVIVLEHTPEIGVLLKAADLVISRAGGATLAELTALGKPAIVVPWPGAVGGHQEKNARWLAERGACLLLLEDQLQQKELVDEILRLLRDPSQLFAMAQASARLGRIDALDHVIREVEPYLHHGTSSRVLSFHRHRRGWHERLGLGAPRARPSHKRLGS